MAALIMGAMMMASCGNGADNKTDETATAASTESTQGVQPMLRLESYTYDMIGELANPDSLNAPGSKYVHIQGEGVIPAESGDAGVTALRDSLLRLAGLSFNEEGRPVPQLADSVTLTDLPVNGTEALNESESSISAMLVSPRVAVFEYSAYGYLCPAAHGNTTRTFVNYSVADGKILTLSDIVKAGNDATLKKMIYDKLVSENVPLLVKQNEIEIPTAFEVTGSGISFSYDPYAVAPYSEGVVSVPFTVYDLEEAGLLTPGGYQLLTGSPQPAKAAK